VAASLLYPKIYDAIRWEDFGAGPVAIDFEYEGDKPTILGLSQNGIAASAPWDDYCGRILLRLEEAGAIWLGYNFIMADLPLLTGVLGKPPKRYVDVILLYYLLNADLCKNAPKDEEDEDRGRGFMDLWSMASLYTDLPQWKHCRGELCEGPCPVHNVFYYNALDALALELAYPKLLQELEEKKIPVELYDHLHKLTHVCWAMEQQGIKIDWEYVDWLSEQIDRTKAGLFPYREIWEGKSGRRLKHPRIEFDAPFNPQSPRQILEWFKEQRVPLESASLQDLHKAAERIGFSHPAAHWLEKLIKYKEAGKGLKAWFDRSHAGKDGLIYPRFIPYGTSTGRLASSGPNFQNIPRVGWGKQVRRAIIPRDPSLELAKADYSQIELRMCLWYAGVEADFADAFSWLVEQVGRPFEQAASLPFCTYDSPRDIAKSVGHACLTPDHEVYTEQRGWVRIDQLRHADKVLVWDPGTFSTYFAFPLAYYRYYVKEPLVRITGHGFSTVCTRNHYFPISPHRDGEVFRVPAEVAVHRGGLIHFMFGDLDNPLEILPKQDVEMTTEYYEGPVYCLAVPTKFFVVRHGGSVHITGNSNYGEGLVVLPPGRLEKSKNLISRGALKVYRDWEYAGGVVGFTGVNLAMRLFGSASLEHRKLALEIQDQYFRRFPQIREWQKKLSEQAEKGYVQTASGRYLRLQGSPEERLKQALAFHGQGGAADYCQEAMIKYYQSGHVPLLQVHDELVFEIPATMSDKQVLEFFSVMQQESSFFPGFTCPVKVKRGSNYLDMREISKR